MTEWHTAEPPWLAKLHPDLVEEPPASQERTAEQRAQHLLEQLERAAAGRIPPALAGGGWAEAELVDYTDEPTKPVIRERVPGPYPCQLPEPHVCDECGREFRTAIRLSAHRLDHRQAAPQPAPAAPTRAGTATKPRPGARTKRKRRR